MTDPVATAVLQNRLGAIAEEMGEAMLRTSYSQILNSSRDFSIAIIDGACRLLAQADHIPVHVGAMPFAARAVADAFPDPRPGDVFLLNDPYHGGSHLPDLTAVVPVFGAGSVPMFWSVVRAHYSDIGGSTHGGYNPGATEIWQEGLRVPPIRLTDNGIVRDDLVRMLAANTRNPRDFRGDMAAMIGAARLGAQRLATVLAEDGAGLAAGLEAVLDAAERHSRAIVATWTPGVYEGLALLDDDGHGATDIRIHARVTVADGAVTVDLTGSDPQVRGFVNSSYANMRSAVAMAFAYLLDPDCPRNDGAFRPLEIVARPGTVVWANEGAAVTMCTSHCSNEIVEAVVVALAGACPDRTMGGWGRRFRVALTGRDGRTGRRFIWHMFHARPGGGASSAGDGWNAAGEWHSAGGIKFASVEVTEARFPLVLEKHEFRAGSGGAGHHRGGDGAELLLCVEADGMALANTAGDGVRHGARGVAGGEDGLPHLYTLHAPDAEPLSLRTKEVGIQVPPGSRFHVLSGGGGGWGAK